MDAGSKRSSNHCKHNGCSSLIVCNDETTSESISMVLTAIGFQVQRAKSGKETLKYVLAPERPISFVIMEVEAVHLDEVQIVEKIREADPNTKIIAYGDHATSSLWKAKPDAFLLRPFMHLELRTTIRGLLKQV